MKKIRRYHDSDYNTLCSWWTEYGHIAVPKSYLSDCGFIVENGAACFVYETRSSLVWTEFIVANPFISKEERAEAINLLIKTVCQYCKDKGYLLINTSVENNSLKEKLLNAGFMESSSDIKFMIKGVA